MVAGKMYGVKLTTHFLVLGLKMNVALRKGLHGIARDSITFFVPF
jgi:hypothetical protein